MTGNGCSAAFRRMWSIAPDKTFIEDVQKEKEIAYENIFVSLQRAESLSDWLKQLDKLFLQEERMYAIRSIATRFILTADSLDGHARPEHYIFFSDAATTSPCTPQPALQHMPTTPVDEFVTDAAVTSPCSPSALRTPPITRMRWGRPFDSKDVLS